MKRLPILLLLALPFVTFSQSAWNDKMYQEYDYKSFKKLPAAAKTIDFKNIDYPLLHAALFYATNEQRAKHKVATGRHSPVCEKAAYGHSVDMVRGDFFSHTSKIKNKKTVMDRMKLAGYKTGGVAENIAITFALQYEAGKPVYTPSQNDGYFSYTYKGEPIQNHTYLSIAKAALVQWMNSPGHRANILEGFAYFGCGGYLIPSISKDKIPKFKLTQNFATRY